MFQGFVECSATTLETLNFGIYISIRMVIVSVGLLNLQAIRRTHLLQLQVRNLVTMLGNLSPTAKHEGWYHRPLSMF